MKRRDLEAMIESALVTMRRRWMIEESVGVPICFDPKATVTKATGQRFFMGRA
jgi:hypothetical protein